MPPLFYALSKFDFLENLWYNRNEMEKFLKKLLGGRSLSKIFSEKYI